jgi:hypothetical protein
MNILERRHLKLIEPFRFLKTVLPIITFVVILFDVGVEVLCSLAWSSSMGIYSFICLGEPRTYVFNLPLVRWLLCC